MVLRHLATCFLAFVLSAALGPVARTDEFPPADVEFFETEIRPLLAAKCWKCHGGAKTEGELKLQGRRQVLQGGDRGAAVVPHKPDESLLIKAIGYTDKDLRMPPDGKLPEADRQRLARWISLGLPWSKTAGAPTASAARVVVTEAHRRHWAFRPLAPPDVPNVADRARVRTEVDAFILHALEKKGLAFSPDADRFALVRRVSFDLLGLPPTPEEVDEFVDDVSPEAYERLLDRLLASPHFGERWGRHWLDGAGYVDVYSGDNDAAIIKLGENKWLYRDYVIRSFNADRPFDRFLVEQLAGDELVDWRAAPTFTPEIQELLVATGFLRSSADDTNENELNTPDIRYGVLHRTVEIAASNLLGLTLACAKCHDHKYEPLTQRDYYQFQALFHPAFNPEQWRQPQERQLPNISPTQKQPIDRENAELDRQIGEIKSRIAAIRRPYEEKLKAEEVAAALAEADKTTIAAAENEIKELGGRKKGWQHWQVVYDVGPPTPTRILKRGSPLAPGDEALPGFLSVLSPSESASIAPLTKAAGESSGRRLALARWLTDSTSPAGALAIRVRVNRVWQELFGRGLVETADNFGVTGAAPTHPELLDALAHEFVAGGQRLKPLLSRIMLSTVYRQASSGTSDSAIAADANNDLLWRQRLRRLESEAVRDAMLAVSGRLDRSHGGPPIAVESRPDGSFVVKEQGLPTPTSQFRRTIYLLSRRHYHPTLLGVFDQPNVATNCTRRAPSAVVLQSLAMLNDKLVIQEADAITERLIKQAGPVAGDRASAAFRLILGRSAKPAEAAWCLESVEREIKFHEAHEPNLPPEEASRRAWARVCHTLLNTSEFIYIP